MRVAEAIRELNDRIYEMREKYCDHCQEFTCDECNEETDGNEE